MTKPKIEVIVDMGVELGSLTLQGVRTGKGWRFRRDVRDQTPLLLDEPEIAHSSQSTSSWDEALALLDRYPWHRMYPIQVHPEFREKVWSAVQERLARDPDDYGIERWRELCKPLPPELTLLAGEKVSDIDALARMFEKLTGRKPTPAELRETKKKLRNARKRDAH